MARMAPLPPGFQINPGRQRGGYRGIEGILKALSGGINQTQFDRMLQGYTGANGRIGGMRGAFSGLSPYAVNFLASSGILARDEPELLPLKKQVDTDGDGTMEEVDLEGPELFRTTILNQLRQAQPARYSLAEGVDSGFLEEVFGMIPQGAYRKGFNAQGRLPRPPKPVRFKPPRKGGRKRLPDYRLM